MTPRSSAKLAPFRFGRITPLIDPDEIERLLGDLESDRVERTESVDNSVKFCKAICAFANDLPAHRAPGYLCIGVDKFGAPTSTPINERLLEALASHRNPGGRAAPYRAPCRPSKDLGSSGVRWSIA